MRIKEIISETWWEDLDDGFLTMMGYAPEEDLELESNLDDISADVKNIRQS